MEFVGQTADGRSIRYIDKKRYLWLLSLTGGFNPPIAIGLYFASGHNPFAMLFPLLYTFVVIPIVDALMGEDRHNPPEEVVRHMAHDNYYRTLLYVGIVLLFAYSLGLGAAFVLAGIAFAHAMRAFRWVRTHYDTLRYVSGSTLVALGLLLFFHRDWWLHVALNRLFEYLGLSKP